MIEPINKALFNENIPFRWVEIEAHDLLNEDSSSALLYLPISVVKELKKMLDLVDKELCCHELYISNIDTSTTNSNFNFSRKVVLKKVNKSKKILSSKVFRFDGECIDNYDDYYSLFQDAFSISNNKLSDIIINCKEINNSENERMCEVSLEKSGYKISNSLKVEGWVDKQCFLELLNSLCQSQNISERFFELTTEDQSVEITFMTEQEFKKYI